MSPQANWYKLNSYGISSMLLENDAERNNVTQGPTVHLKPTTLLSKQRVYYPSITGEATQVQRLTKVIQPVNKR